MRSRARPAGRERLRRGTDRPRRTREPRRRIKVESSTRPIRRGRLLVAIGLIVFGLAAGWRWALLEVPPPLGTESAVVNQNAARTSDLPIEVAGTGFQLVKGGEDLTTIPGTVSIAHRQRLLSAVTQTARDARVLRARQMAIALAVGYLGFHIVLVGAVRSMLRTRTAAQRGRRLAPESRARRWLTVGGCVTSGLAAVGGAAVLLRPINDVPRQAVEAVALGWTHLDAGRVEEAIHAFDEGAALDEFYDASYVGRATAHLHTLEPDLDRMGTFTDDAAAEQELYRFARRDARATASLGPTTHWEESVAVAELALLSGDYGEAIPRLREAARIADPEDSAATAVERDRLDFRLWLAELVRSLDNRQIVLDEDYLRTLVDIVRVEDDRAETRWRASRIHTAVQRALYNARTGVGPTVLVERAGEDIIDELIRLEWSMSPSARAAGGGTISVVAVDQGAAEMAVEVVVDAPVAVAAVAFERHSPDGPWLQPADAMVAKTVPPGQNRVTVPVDPACRAEALRLVVTGDGATIEEFITDRSC